MFLVRFRNGHMKSSGYIGLGRSFFVDSTVIPHILFMYDSLFVVPWTDRRCPAYPIPLPTYSLTAPTATMFHCRMYNTLCRHTTVPLFNLMNNTYTKYFSQFNLLYLGLISKVFRCFLFVLARLCICTIMWAGAAPQLDPKQRNKKGTMQLISDMIFAGELKIRRQTSELGHTNALRLIYSHFSPRPHCKVRQGWVGVVEGGREKYDVK